MTYDELDADEAVRAREMEARYGAARRQAEIDAEGRAHVIEGLDESDEQIASDEEERTHILEGLDDEEYATCAECGGSFVRDLPGDAVCGDCEPGPVIGPAPVRPGTVEVVASAYDWGEVVAELVWISTGNAARGNPEEADRLLAVLTDNAPEGVEEYEDSTEESYGIWLTRPEWEAVERITDREIGTKAAPSSGGAQ